MSGQRGVVERGLLGTRGLCHLYNQTPALTVREEVTPALAGIANTQPEWGGARAMKYMSQLVPEV